MFDFLDGKVARWRKSSSMLGQELDSLADLVCLARCDFFFPIHLYQALDIIWSRPLTIGVCSGAPDISRHSRPNELHLLWTRSFSEV